MCCFAQPVESVSDTNIFARLLPDGWQSLVYQMTFESKQANAMVLPLPVALPSKEEGTLEFISLKEHKRFFKDLRRGFPVAVSRSFGLAIDSAKEPEAATKLVVHDVGDFIASFVPSVADFERLDEQFRLPSGSLEKIPQYSDYGFAVFQLKPGQGKPHPMAFKFRSRLSQSKEGNAVFFPTVHIHDGEVHEREKFDHTLYLQAPEFDAACGKYKHGTRLVADQATGYVRSKWVAGEFCNVKASQGIIDGDSLVHRRRMRGTFANQDVLAKLNATTPRKAAWLSPLSSLGAITCAAGIGGFSWLVNRRNRMAHESADEE